MRFLTAVVGALTVISLAVAEDCPGGGRIYERGITEYGKIDIVIGHNKYRKMIIDGAVPNQPKGKDIKMLEGHDVYLAREAKMVSDTCRNAHVNVTDWRWSLVGQNTYTSWSNQNVGGQDWNAAINAWYSGHEDFTYPNVSSGHAHWYTQLIWDSSNTVGCDFIRFYDTRDEYRAYPYAKMYTCLYGPGGNIPGEVPYQTA